MCKEFNVIKFYQYMRNKIYSKIQQICNVSAINMDNSMKSIHDQETYEQKLKGIDKNIR